MEKKRTTLTKTDFILSAPQNIQDKVETALRNQGLSEEDIQTGLEGRFVDLEDTIDLSLVL